MKPTEAKSQHTPGPWTLKNEIEIVGPDWREGMKPIAFICRDAYLIHTEEFNASLIVAAPTLLEAAKKALKELEATDGYNNGNQRIGDVVFDLSQAIARAEGK